MLVMTAGADVGVHYRWTALARDQVSGDDGAGEQHVSRHNSRVSIRLEPLAHISSGPVFLAGDLPEVGGIDDVWAQVPGARSAKSALIGRQL